MFIRIRNIWCCTAEWCGDPISYDSKLLCRWQLYLYLFFFWQTVHIDNNAAAHVHQLLVFAEPTPLPKKEKNVVESGFKPRHCLYLSWMREKGNMPSKGITLPAQNNHSLHRPSHSIPFFLRLYDSYYRSIFIGPLPVIGSQHSKLNTPPQRLSAPTWR